MSDTNECRLRYLLKCHMFGTILTAMNSGRACRSHVYLTEVLAALVLAAELCPVRPQALKKTRNSQAFPKQGFVFIYFSEQAGSRYLKAYVYENSRQFSTI